MPWSRPAALKSGYVPAASPMSSTRTTSLDRHASRHGPRPERYWPASISGDAGSVYTDVVTLPRSSRRLMPAISADGIASMAMVATR